MPNSPKIAPYGSWKSPITSDLIVEGSVGLSQPTFDGEDIYWVELRPKESGRNVIVRRAPDGTCTDITPASFNARTRVHEYGGGDYLVQDGTIYFSNFSDQRLYRQQGHSKPEPLTDDANMRYSDGRLDHLRRRIVCVREDHTIEGSEPVNSIVGIDLNSTGGTGTVLVEGNDFYSPPATSIGGEV